MKLTILTIGLAALIAAGTAIAAPGQGGGAQSKPQSAKPQKQAEEQVRDSHDKAKGEASRTEEQVRSREADGAGGDGGETSAQMQERAQERKEIQEEYQTARKSGEGEQIKGKKPWWKFWENDEAPD